MQHLISLLSSFFRFCKTQPIWGLGFYLAVSISTLFSLTGYLGEVNRYLELTSHFKFQYLIVGFISVIFFTIKHNYRLIILSLFCIFINLNEILPWYLNRYQSPEQIAPNLRVMLVNVNTENRKFSQVVSQIDEERPDLVVFVEVNKHWLKALEAIQDRLPHTLLAPRSARFGIALYSAFPLKNSSTQYLGNDRPSLVTEIEIDGNTITAIATHPPPPINKTLSDLRKKQFDEVSNYLLNIRNSILLVGDLNITMWSPYYKKFVQKTGLQNSRQGFGILPTWPTQFPLLSIPLDHCLVSPEIKVLKSKSGRNMGSDHRPFISDLVVGSSSLSSNTAQVYP